MRLSAINTADILPRVTSRRRLRYVAAGTLVLLVASCAGGGGSSGTSTSGGAQFAPVYVPVTTAPHSTHGVPSAKAERDRLLDLAQPGTKLTSQGTVPGWPSANGAAIPATASQVSGFGFLSDTAKHVQYLGFAVKDSAGHCAGGDIEADSGGTYVQSAEPVEIPRHAPCTGDEAAKVAGHS